MLSDDGPDPGYPNRAVDRVGTPACAGRPLQGEPISVRADKPGGTWGPLNRQRARVTFEDPGRGLVELGTHCRVIWAILSTVLQKRRRSPADTSPKRWQNPGVPSFLRYPRMTTAEFLASIVARLDAAEISHMIAGSVASSHHGEPRSTQDIDLVIRKDRPFSESEFARREPVEILGVVTAVATVEDTILAKLEWARESESERQLRDVAAMIRVHGAALDVAYLRRWAGELGVKSTLETELGASA